MSLNDFLLRTLRCSLPSPDVNALLKRPLLCLLLVALAVPKILSGADELPAAVGAPPPAASTNTSTEAETQMLRSFLLLQDQLRATQRAIEQTREQAQADARRAEELLSVRLNLIEQTLSAQRAQEVASLQQSTRMVTVISLVVTAVGLLAVVFAGFVQVKAMTRLAEVSRQLREALPALQLSGAHSPALLVGRESIEVGNTNLLGAIDRLQKRLEEMESATGTQTTTNGHAQLAAPTLNPQVTTVLAKGQALLNLDKAEEALDQFDEALRIEPKNTEAWIKKGTALERLQRVDEAITAYDEAIAADSSTATAYLFKAGVYNRQKKYAEALQCYEKALSAQQKVRGSAARA
jgi:tetratricopeptide (TPR) repeat protein